MNDFATAFAQAVGVQAEKPVVAEQEVVVDKVVETPQSLPTDKVDEPKEDKTDDPKVDEPKERDFEKDSAFAKLRREKEAIERKAKEEQAERDTWYAEQYAEYGIKSEAEYRQRMKEQKQAELLEKAELGDVAAVDELATMKADDLVSEKLKAKELELTLEREVLELNKLYDLKLQSINDLVNIENGNEIIAIMSTRKSNGEYFTANEAYRMANVETLLAQAEKSAKQQTKNEQAGFKHTSVDNKGGAEHSDVTIPADVLAEYDKWGIKPDLNHIKNMMKK